MFSGNALFTNTLNANLNTRIQTAQFLMELAASDELFLYPKITDIRDFGTILRLITPEFSIVKDEEYLIPQEKVAQRWTVASPDGQTGYMRRYTNGGISLNVEDFKSGSSRGSAFIIAVITYAHNNGYRFEGDREGYNELGMIRAYEHFLSAALKFSTTKHLDPSSHLRENMDWRDGEDLHNIAELIRITYKNTRNLIPEITDFRYNFTDRIFEKADENGQWRPVEDIRGRHEGESETTLAGRDGTSVFSRNTIKRAILVQSCLSRTLQGTGSQVRDEILAPDAGFITDEQHPSAGRDIQVDEFPKHDFLSPWY